MHRRLKWTSISLLFFLFFLTSLVEAKNTPSRTSEVHPSAEANLFYRSGDWEHVLKYRWAPDAQESFKKMSFSTRREFKNLYKIGLYVARTAGERHFLDWQKINGQFQWRDLDGEGENNLGAFIQKKWPHTDHLGFELRISYEKHFNHSMKFLRIRPGVTWLTSSMWTTYLKYEAYKLIDSDISTLYRTGLYLGGLYRGFSQILIGPFLKYQRQEWWTSPDFKKEFGDEYRSHEHNYSLGVSFMYYL